MQNFLPNAPTPPTQPHPDAAAPTVVLREQPRSKKPRWRRWAVVVVLVVVIVAAACMIFAASRLAQSFARVRDAAVLVETAVRDGDFDAADAALADAALAIDAARIGLTFIPFLRVVPWLGTQLQGLAYTLDAGGATIAALREAIGILRDVQTVVADAQRLVGITENDLPYHELSTSARIAMLEALHDAYPDFLQMQVKLALAQDDIARLQDLNVSQALKDMVAPFADILAPLRNGVDLLTPFAAVVPDLAGLGEDRQFLLIFANDTELRPGGGFIGVYGLAITRDGEIVQMSTNDVYGLDSSVPAEYRVTPPVPLRRIVDNWYFRDSNWSPDFPTSTQDGVTLLRQEYAASGQPVPEIHGALMFTPTFIGRLLDLLGPVTVADQTFTSANIADKLEYQVEIGYAEQGLPPTQRKDIVAAMTGTVIDRLLALPSSSWPQLFDALSDGFAAKEVALWSPDNETQATYVDAGWAGAVTSGAADDALMVVDANLGALKTDAVMARTISYAIVPTRAGYQAAVELAYTNNGAFSWKTTRYLSHTRVYAPLGSTLIEGPSDATTTEELGMTVFATNLTVEPGSTQTRSFTYLLPPSVGDAIAEGRYELRVMKQLGAASHDLTLHLAFPSEVTFAVPAEEERNWRDNAYDVTTELATDMTFDVNLAK